MNNSFDDILKTYNPVSLDKANGISLMRRKDWKYVFNISQLPDILKGLKSEYNVLEISGLHSLKYINTYFDTPDFDFYKHHHNDKLNRFKVRKREYAASEQSFLEVKYKTNKLITIKKRRRLKNGSSLKNEDNYKFINNNTNLQLENLEAKLTTSFNRITLININRNERITFDINLKLETDTKSVKFNNLVVAELKQDIFTKTFSPAKKLMKEFGIRPYRISKYCMGIYLLNKNIKYNRFKSKLLTINKICNGEFIIE